MSARPIRVRAVPEPAEDELLDRRVRKGPPRLRTGKGARPDEYSRSCVLLRPATKYNAMRRLMDLESPEDFSDLVERLVLEWLRATPAPAPQEPPAAPPAP